MTSASVFFCNRRSRVGRSGLIDLGGGEEEPDTSSYSHLQRNSHQNSNRRHRPSSSHQLASRRDSNRPHIYDFDLLPRRAPLLRPQPPRIAAISGSGTTSLDQARSQSHSANVTNPQNSSARRARVRFIGNERLPRAVLLARERLLQRLRGVSVSENRQDNRDPLSTLDDDWPSEEGGIRLPDAGNSESFIVRERPAAETSPFTDVSLENSNRPRALSQEAVNSLQVEIFRKSHTHDGVGDILPRECSICLDSFHDGEKLICLPCGHKFHHHCLCHWLHICGDCPYCRTVIVLTSS